MLEQLREKNLTLVSAGYDSWVEGYRGLRPNIFSFVDNEDEFSKDMNSCIIILENGEIKEENLKVAYKYFIAQKFSLPKII